VFQAVQNPARALPYVAGAMVTAGLLWQFGWSLVAYLRRRRGREAGQGAVDVSGSRERLLGVRGTLMVLAVGFAIALSGVVRQPAPDGVGGAVFAALPVSAGGRVKPVDSAARSVLVLVSGRQDVEMFGERAAASEFLLDLIADPTRVADVPIVRVEEPGVLALLGRSPSERGLVSLSEIDAAWAEVVRASDRASLLGEHARDAFDDAVLLLRGRAELLRAVSRLDEPFVVAPLDDGAAWRPFGSDADAAHPSEAYWRAMLGAHRDGNAAEFAAFAREYQRLLAEELPDAARRADVEVLLNRAQPFVGAAAVYVLAGIAVGTSFLMGGVLSGRLRASASLLMLAAFSVHTLAIVVRVYLQERPPVTNLYSSAVFVGWGSVLAAMFFERAHKLGVALLVGSAVGFGSLVVAHNLAGSGDTMAMMQAVLDSNLWLASHVVTITLGYSLAFLAGALGCVRLVWDALPGGCPRDRSATLSRMVYGAVCAALLLSFAGTMLGGVWADQAWGRFWGWDPKENGAALVVLMNAVILHARFGGLVGARGVAALAVVGNIVTAWSWFGTNLLGVGLHSYGFIDGAAGWLWLFCGANALVAMLVFAPPRRRSRAGVTSA
jgi:ABC-type transport system involved in cytochrome c biogenesis permease subunit